ncbi:MAG: LOG family protein, partial [Ferruginibacter sp.]
GLKELIIVDSMHTRKKMLYERCDAAIILPGGYGTLDEVFEMLTWNQLKLHQKDMYILNSGAFYDPLIQHIKMMLEGGFLYEELGFKMRVLSEPTDIIPFL